ncbi:hypothetical protein Micbo1qcDRAFT_168054 [Microdochium bolleyi]|uniref:Uncharacterized protein n=1 Tax=Microdochium bolleyi TaxID=196109 RepID=A0A136IPZ9_9PEZI|nr:hypothetical protein Micbo1qcDRAFT_168054 [Microdochium bolleyi]
MMIRQARALTRPSSRACTAPTGGHNPPLRPWQSTASFSSRSSLTKTPPTVSSSTLSQTKAPRPSAPWAPRPNGTPRRFFHYNPQPYQPHPQQGKPWLKVLRDMALGSVLTIALSTAYDYYEERQYMKQATADQEWAEDLRVQLVREFDEARRTPLDETAGDNADFERQRKLRELTFGLPLRVVSAQEIEEAGWLPGFPYGDELHGKERVPAEETKMYVGKDELGGISAVYVAANVDVDQKVPQEQYGEESDDNSSGDRTFASRFAPAMDTGPDERRVVPREWEDAAGNVIGELVARVRQQKDLWKRQGRLSQVEEDFLLVVLYLRNRTWMFLLDRGEVQPVSGVANILK